MYKTDPSGKRFIGDVLLCKGELSIFLTFLTLFTFGGGGASVAFGGSRDSDDVGSSIGTSGSVASVQSALVAPTCLCMARRICSSARSPKRSAKSSWTFLDSGDSPSSLLLSTRVGSLRHHCALCLSCCLSIHELRFRFFFCLPLLMLQCLLERFVAHIGKGTGTWTHGSSICLANLPTPKRPCTKRRFCQVYSPRSHGVGLSNGQWYSAHCDHCRPHHNELDEIAICILSFFTCRRQS